MQLKAPFPYFGAKSRAAAAVWQLFGEVRNYVEPFAGSLAVLLNRPSPFSGPETVNDLDCLLVNAWRAIAGNPTQLAGLLIAPVAEVETEAQHNVLMNRKDALREKTGDPYWFDLRQAAWWIKGANEWIGSGWCAAEGPWSWTAEQGWQSNAGKGINRKLPHLGNAGRGINRQLPHLGDAGTGAFANRLEFVSDWLCALRDRLCSVRIACGDWRRVLGESVTTKHGITAVFLDPPYDGTEYVYGTDKPVSAEVREWCVANGGNTLLRIILAGRGEEHDSLLDHGWSKETWSALKGYANHEERHEEALWCSPECIKADALKQSDLF